MTDIIEQLKANEKPFGLMSEEMQQRATEIGIGEFWVYTEFGQMGLLQPPVWGKHPKRFEWDHAFRLRPDYEEPEIEECEIYEDGGHLHFQYCMFEGNRHAIHQAIDHPDFIGFKFEDGMVGPASIYYRDAVGNAYCKAADGIDEITVLHAKSVLFRRMK